MILSSWIKTYILFIEKTCQIEQCSVSHLNRSLKPSWLLSVTANATSRHPDKGYALLEILPSTLLSIALIEMSPHG
jgi:hypothetical protein